MTSRIGSFVLAATLFLPASCASQPTPAPSPAPSPAPAATPTAVANDARLYVFISDLHFNLGRRPGGDWNPIEDFRWSNALKGFLKEIARRSDGKTTLVIAGDMLEMWQHPDLPCSQGDADHGCTVEEMGTLADAIVKAHAADLEALGAFASDADNRLVIIPGNHDSSLLVPSIQAKVAAALKAKAGRVTFPPEGVWASPDGRIVSEHGHQMPLENINNWKKWPTVTEMLNGKEFLRRPWGELFVHNLYDKVEKDNEIIDNLIPQSNGVKHLIKKEGFFGAASDVARFLAFNIGQTSLAQKGALGQPPSGKLEWDVDGARQKGWELFAAANSDDFTRGRLTNPPDESWKAVRAQLDALARDTDATPDDEVRNLCDKAKKLAATGNGVCPLKNPELLIDTVGGAIPGAAYRSMSTHLKKRHETFPRMEVFVYGHTHILQCTTAVTPKGDTTVQVANTGAFQRLIDDERFVAEAARRGWTPEDALGKLKLEDLPPCYTAVLVRYENGTPVARVQNWIQAETDAAGTFADPSDCRCSKLGSHCEGGAPCPGP
jgi:hypothetical protein